MKKSNFISTLFNLFKKEEKLLSINNKSFTYYRKYVKGNRHISYDQARRKMTRNMHLAYQYRVSITPEGRVVKHYTYGNLCFGIIGNEVVSIDNYQPIHSEWKQDYPKYLALSKRFGIDEEGIK